MVQFATGAVVPPDVLTDHVAPLSIELQIAPPEIAAYMYCPLVKLQVTDTQFWFAVVVFSCQRTPAFVET